MESKVIRLLQPTGLTKDHNPTDLAAFERGMYNFLPSNVSFLRDFVYPLVRQEPNLFSHPLVHLLHDQSELPLDINEMRRRFQTSDQYKYYFVMPEGPTVGRENAIEIEGSKTFWSKTGDEFHIRDAGYSYADITLYAYIHGENAISWYMVVYHVDPHGVLKCGPVELGLHQVELRWKGIMIYPKYANLNVFKEAPPLFPAPRFAISGMYAFVPSDICLLRDFVYPLVRHEPNLFPHPFVHQLHDQSELPIDIDEMRRRFQIWDHRFIDKYYFVMLEKPPTGEKNAIEIGGTKVFWKRIGLREYIYDKGLCTYGNATKYTYIRGERDIGWYMVIYRANLFKVRTCGPLELGLSQIESRWSAINIFPKDASMLVFNPEPFLVVAPSTPLGDKSPPPPPSPLASIGSKCNCCYPPALSGNKRNRYHLPA